jgi:serine/threonine-protein kinase 24/25/MST4
VEGALARYTRGTCDLGAVFNARADSFANRVDKRTGQSVAIKIIDVENAEDEVEDIIQEISILSELHSPYVTKYHGSFLKGSDLWIVMEFCSGGSCSDLMRPGLIAEDYICIIIRELLMGLEYLHGDKKLHRDIKGAHYAPFQYRSTDPFQPPTYSWPQMVKSNSPTLGYPGSFRQP